VRVVIADDSMLLREGLAKLLADSGVDVAGTASTAGELLTLIDRTGPDIAIVDIRMPPTHSDEGIVAAQAIARTHPGVGVLVLSQYLDSAYAARLLAEVPERAGYLLKDRVSDIAVLIDALHRITEGECVVDPTIVSQLVQRPRRRGPLDELTARGVVADRRGAQQSRHLAVAVPQRQDRRVACQADLPEARPPTIRQRAPAGDGRAHVPARLNSGCTLMPSLPSVATMEEIGPTLLIVDDHDAFRAIARLLLEADGFDVVAEAATGSAGIAAANALRPDVVLLDVMLPDLDGFAVCERITTDTLIQVVLTSSRDASNYRGALEHSRARGFLAKSDLSGAALAALLD
jgi:serine/threonine-protein kinase